MGAAVASIIPGLRHLRTPLAAGYLALFAIWLAVEGSLPARNKATGVIAALIDLAQAATTLGVAIALSFVAYLLGSLIEGLVTAGRKAYKARQEPDPRRAGESAPSFKGWSSLEVLCGERAREARDKLEASGHGLSGLPRDLIEDDVWMHTGDENFPARWADDENTQIRQLTYSLHLQTLRELDLVTTRLLGQPGPFGHRPPKERGRASVHNRSSARRNLRRPCGPHELVVAAWPDRSCRPDLSGRQECRGSKRRCYRHRLGRDGRGARPRTPKASNR